MKRTIGFLLSLALIFALAIPCFAAQPEPRTVSSQYVYDNKGNRFLVTGYTELGACSPVANTSFSVVNYGGGVASSINGVAETVTVDCTIYFSNGTTPNYTAMDDSAHCVGWTSNSVSTSQTFTAVPANILCTHSFSTNTGASVSFSTGAWA